MSDRSGHWGAKPDPFAGLRDLEAQVRRYQRTRKLQHRLVGGSSLLLGVGAITLVWTQVPIEDLPQISIPSALRQYVGFGLVVIFTVAATIAYFRADRSSKEGSDAAIERSFKNVFAFVTQERREQMIRHYVLKNGVSRIRAMAIAIEDRHADEQKFR